MNFNLVPSLKHVSLAKIATQLWNKDFLLDKSTKKLNVYLTTKEKVETLPLPTCLKLQLVSFIKPIGMQIHDWFKYLNENFKVKRINLKNIRWTSYGTIDKAKTAQLLLQRVHSLNLQQRYEIACAFCLVEQVQALLQKKKKKLKKKRLQALAYSRLVQTNDRNLVLYFIQSLKNDIYYSAIDPLPNLSPYHQACYSAILSANPTATKYLFQKLSSEEKNRLLSFLAENPRHNIHHFGFTWLPDEFLAELTCFLLSQMDENQREKYFKSCGGWTLRNFVIWPYNRHFLLETTNRMWDYLRGSDFEKLLHFVFSQITKCQWVDCEYREMYFELWRSSPAPLRRYFVDHFDNCDAFNYILVRESEIFKLVWNEALTIQNERLILNEKLQNFYALFGGN